MSHALAEAGDATVFLSVTGSGRPLCEKLGFGPAGDAQTLVADIASAATGPVRLDLDGRHPHPREWATGTAWRRRPHRR
jgi:hypothetical protein